MVKKDEIIVGTEAELREYFSSIISYSERDRLYKEKSAKLTKLTALCFWVNNELDFEKQLSSIKDPANGGALNVGKIFYCEEYLGGMHETPPRIDIIMRGVYVRLNEIGANFKAAIKESK